MTGAVGLLRSTANSGSRLSNVEIKARAPTVRSEEHTSELQSRPHLVCRLLLEKKKRIEQRHDATLDRTLVVETMAPLVLRARTLPRYRLSAHAALLHVVHRVEHVTVKQRLGEL